MEIIKKNIAVYQLRQFKDSTIWADIYIDENKDGTGGALSIRSDYGSWSYYWGSCGCTLKEFLCKIDTGYLMGKLGKQNEFDIDRWEKDANDKIDTALKEGYISNEDHSHLLQEIEEVGQEGFRSEEALYIYLRETQSKLFLSFADSESFPRGNDYPYDLKMFIENIWKSFVKELKKEI